MNPELFVAVFVGGFFGAMAVRWRLWRDFFSDLRWHGLDNRLCHRAECCGKDPEWS